MLSVRTCERLFDKRGRRSYRLPFIPGRPVSTYCPRTYGHACCVLAGPDGRGETLHSGTPQWDSVVPHDGDELIFQSPESFFVLCRFPARTENGQRGHEKQS